MHKYISMISSTVQYIELFSELLSVLLVIWLLYKPATQTLGASRNENACSIWLRQLLMLQFQTGFCCISLSCPFKR